ncbi:MULTISPECIES: cytochrome b/b6 domain-containing protein [unclassified Microbacterium]|uniref:cytochrome b/b6 domain-containing protein n=1 Tax=unclassified Microbacterium TaxID=2609290 RepID=UPI00342C9CEC
MAERMLRRGLPRTPGGEPWPPGGAVVVVPGTPAAEPPVVESPVVESPVAESPVVESPVVERAERDETRRAPEGVAPQVVPQAERDETRRPARTTFRRGLPRTPGGEPWPPAGTTAETASVGEPVSSRSTPSSSLNDQGVAEASSVDDRGAVSTSSVDDRGDAEVSSLDDRGEIGASVRRGLPRTVGGEPWPPAGTVPRETSATSDVPVAGRAEESLGAMAPTATGTPVAAASAPSTVVATTADVSTPLPWSRTVWNGRAPRHVAAAPASARPRPTWTQGIAVLLGAAALGILAGAAIAFVRTLLSLPFMQDFLMAFPGEYEPAVHVEPGFAPWIGWQHFFNVFLMVLIIRSGLTIRTEKRPTAFWTPRNNPKGKVSLTIWFHQALDVLWLVNGVIFVVLLFTTGHWARIVPTSWEVFPNALSAALQYVSFDWPHENGWNNYNSLQQLAYFATVFLAAPLAAITGFRMSGMWPKKAERLSKAYPIEWARALHFPVMLYFVAFIIAHVALVMLTGFLRNLNHMYASQDAVTWTGFWVFVASLVVIAVGWVAARPLVIAPIAKLFGNVSGR